MKRDNFISSLLTLAIAILFPIVVYYFASLIVPSTETGSQFSRYTSRPADDSVIMFRSVISLLLAFVAFAVSLASLRPHRELFRGLIGGSVIIVIISNAFVAFSINGSERAAAFVIQWTSFILLYAAIHYASRNLPHIVIKQDDEKTKSPFENPTQQSATPKAVYPGDTPPAPITAPTPNQTDAKDEQEPKDENRNNET